MLAGEEAIPPAVMETMNFFINRGLWGILSRNAHAMSCREAANVRYRLGAVGIPLRDELKSYVTEGHSNDGEITFLLLHCRADRSIDFGRVSALDLPVGDLKRANLSEIDFKDFGYGLINPFRAESEISPRHKVVHIFDSDLLLDATPIGSMMTNAGDRTWAIEFRPRDLITSIPKERVTVASFTVLDDAPEALPLPGIGIITGNAPESGMLLWDKVNRIHRRWLGSDFRGDMSYPLVAVYSIPEMGLTMELDRREQPVWDMLSRRIETMIDSGVRVLSVACHTTQYFSERLDALMASAGGVFVPAAPTVRAFVEDQGLRRVLILGIGYSATLGRWSGYSALSDLPNLIRPNARDVKLLSELAYLVKNQGATTQAYQKLRTIIRHYGADADVVLLLLTELSMIHARFPRWPGGPATVIDALDLYAEEVHLAARRFTTTTTRLNGCPPPVSEKLPPG
jgi:aspartate racemase